MTAPTTLPDDIRDVLHQRGHELDDADGHFFGLKIITTTFVDERRLVTLTGAGGTARWAGDADTTVEVDRVENFSLEGTFRPELPEAHWQHLKATLTGWRDSRTPLYVVCLPAMTVMCDAAGRSLALPGGAA